MKTRTIQDYDLTKEIEKKVDVYFRKLAGDNFHAYKKITYKPYLKEKISSIVTGSNVTSEYLFDELKKSIDFEINRIESYKIEGTPIEILYGDFLVLKNKDVYSVSFMSHIDERIRRQ